ncbi:VOC family protein [Parvularcula maris]|uniref:VOC family protein n=1 Tax=Parvularcula maris TaxID=2965077 RepID=A0A9X2L8Z5_9PROT|nr:VOC family protein [Parvularcula maris]MCQ8185260.1 VOC family protein [Parvularcula maris]
MDLNQVTLNVTDFSEAVAFYETLGLKLIVSSRGEYARFELPSGSSTLSLHLSEERTTNGPMIYFECDDLDARVEALKGKGISFETEPTDQPWRWREVRLRDPSGNRLCLFHAGLERRFPPWRIERKHR